MKKIYLFVAAVMMALMPSCATKDDINGLQGQIDELKTGKIATVEQQVKAIQSSISSLEATAAQLSDNLSQEKKVLSDRIDALKKYVDEEIGTKDWVSATFATLEQYQSVLTSLGEIRQSIKDLDTELEESIKISETRMKGWVSDQLEGYYTIAQMDVKLKALADADASALSKFESDLATAKADLTAAYTKAITDAITKYDGEITARIAADIKTATEALQKQIDALDARVSALEGMIQSIVIIPTFSDGSVMSRIDGILPLTCIVSPASAVKGLTAKDVCIYATSVMTKSSTFFTFPAASVSADERTGHVEIETDIYGIMELLGKNEKFSVSVKIKCGKNDYTSSFATVVPEPEYVDLGLSVKWRTCNVGAFRPEAYGNYYQWAGTRDVSNESFEVDLTRCPYHSGNRYNAGWTKYVYAYNHLFPDAQDPLDGKWTLDLEDDAAYANLGGHWRTPSAEEWSELNSQDNCSWTWTNINGVDGYKVQSKKSGYTDNWIFLPAAGYRNNDALWNSGETGYYWSSNIVLSEYYYARSMAFTSDFHRRDEVGRVRGQSIRPVYVDMNSHRHNLNIVVGEFPAPGVPGYKDAYLCIEPFCNKYFEDENGTVLIGDESDYEAWKSEGGNGYIDAEPEVIDLGLSVKWASCNLGTGKKTGLGGYYQWAGTSNVSDHAIYLDWNVCPYHNGSTDSESGWTKYIPRSNPSYWAGAGEPDGKTSLDLEDDAAHVNWGGKWRIPTDSEWSELRNKSNCSWTWMELDGVYGYKVQSRISGYTDNWIFLPAAGVRDKDTVIYTDCGRYWSSSVSFMAYSSPDNANGIAIDQHDVLFGLLERYRGASIRPVAQ